MTASYVSGDITVPMIGYTVAIPRGYDSALGSNTFPEFGVFTTRRVLAVRPSPPTGVRRN